MSCVDVLLVSLNHGLLITLNDGILSLTLDYILSSNTSRKLMVGTSFSLINKKVFGNLLIESRHKPSGVVRFHYKTLIKERSDLV
jgi:hypothetical protein